MGRIDELVLRAPPGPAPGWSSSRRPRQQRRRRCSPSADGASARAGRSGSGAGTRRRSRRPEPVKVRSISGVVTEPGAVGRPPRSCASWSAGASDADRGRDQDDARAAVAERAGRVHDLGQGAAPLVPVRKFSSKWFGVTMSASGTTSSRRNSGMPGMTKKPRPTSPITGRSSRARRGCAASPVRTDSRIRAPMAGAPWKPDSTASTSSRAPRSSMPVTTSPTWSGVRSGPRGGP